MMRLIIHLDDQGLVEVQIVAASEGEQQKAHKLFQSVSTELEALGAAAKRFSSEEAEEAGDAGRRIS